jgi:hypothetical protein
MGQRGEKERKIYKLKLFVLKLSVTETDKIRKIKQQNVETIQHLSVYNITSNFSNFGWGLVVYGKQINYCEIQTPWNKNFQEIIPLRWFRNSENKT